MNQARTYRNLLLSILDETSTEYRSFKRVGGAAFGDFLKALAWLANLPDEVCPFVTDEELTPMEDGDALRE